ncbi:hypothetical protein ACFSJY_13290 [Thalassotalea euphylliae]|uniref:hypothetical protein n=1 Tax=Thalassotalea euphylliae TaxID=1655234 RepID=UPI00363221F2
MTIPSAMERYKSALFFLVILLHIALLNFAFMDESGLNFMPEENLRWSTQLVHLGIAFVTLAVFLVTEAFLKLRKEGKIAIREPILIVCSLSMLISIGFLLMD